LGSAGRAIRAGADIEAAHHAGIRFVLPHHIAAAVMVESGFALEAPWSPRLVRRQTTQVRVISPLNS
jgi:hypothetical protein